MRWLKWLVIVAVVLALGGWAVAWYVGRNDAAPELKTAPIKRGDLVVAINATGTVEPEEVVDVGAQVAGMIKSFGVDANGKTIDYGSVIKANTVLATIDDSLYAADAATAEAQLQQATAGLVRAQADLGQMQARLVQAQRDWERAQKLGASQALAQTQYDAYQSAYETAKANLAVGEATIQQSRAAVKQAEAAKARAQRNLGYATITSPVDGVVIDRRVNIGQTVVASLNAPSLFLIAKDLKRMQVWVAVNEADVGRIRPGMPVTFTVDAFPGERFSGEVGKVRYNASMTQNVVTYTVEVITDNSSGRLLPYLTANVQFEVQRHNDVLMAPNAALRFTPAPEQIEPGWADVLAQRQHSARSRGRGPAASGSTSTSRPTNGGDDSGVLWVEAGQYLRPVVVRVGQSDGVSTEVRGEGLSEGMQVVTSRSGGGAPAGGGTANPFTPQIPRGGRGGR
jgi:HlyD family secretion protein